MAQKAPLSFSAHKCGSQHPYHAKKLIRNLDGVVQLQLRLEESQRLEAAGKIFADTVQV